MIRKSLEGIKCKQICLYVKLMTSITLGMVLIILNSILTEISIVQTYIMIVLIC